MLEIAGAPALTPARLEKRLAAVRRRNPGARALAADLVHFVDVAEPLDAGARDVLERLLRYGPRVPADGARGGAAAAPPADGATARRLLVVPRIGTISPWSSKATDIARICGLTAVRRIERGIW